MTDRIHCAKCLAADCACEQGECAACDTLNTESDDAYAEGMREAAGDSAPTAPTREALIAAYLSHGGTTAEAEAYADGFLSVYPHATDTDCTVVDGSCVVCHVDHSGECMACHGRGFHAEGCAQSDAEATLAKQRADTNAMGDRYSGKGEDCSACGVCPLCESGLYYYAHD